MSETKQAANVNGYELIDEQARAEIAKLKESGGGKLYRHRIHLHYYAEFGDGYDVDISGYFYSTKESEKLTVEDAMRRIGEYGIMWYSKNQGEADGWVSIEGWTPYFTVSGITGGRDEPTSVF